MKASVLLRKLQIDGKEFVTSPELKEYCKKGKFDYDTVVKNLERSKHLTRIFRGIFYVRSPEEIILEKCKYDHLELVAKGLEIKGVTNWYFGLYTALQLNNMTHEYFVVDDILNDTIFRQKPMSIANRKYNFKKISKPLLGFGIKKLGIVNYSDPEKTILDFIYLWKFNGRSDLRITGDIYDWTNNISRTKIKKYSKHYPKSVKKIVEALEIEKGTD
ncbi:MAG: hypothetical protein LVO36_03755 [Nitrosopumilus sp. (ex Thoosa mismalolli)]|nr:hypothetical protein [Nitrosopumilus sp. (ex Thoosa mismalolli)]